jgi:hypothetical protein
LFLRESLSNGGGGVKNVALQLGAWALAIVVVLGCERREQGKNAGVMTTTTRPVDGAGKIAATAPASRPAVSVLQVGDRIVEFPRARLVIQQVEPTVSLLLFSDDPPEAIGPSYMGNRYYFQIDLDITDAAHLASADWVYRAGSMERIDSPNGIFLEGNDKHLQLYLVNMQFNRRGDEVAIVIDGQFTQYSGREDGPPVGVQVRGMLVADLEKRGQKPAKPSPAK